MTVLLASCGGGGGGASSDGNALLSGVLLDSAVSGVHYDDALTGLDGRFFYYAGDTLRFHLGGIELGSVLGRAQVTPYDLAGSHDDYKHDRAIRTARLLQSLDSNANLADGIQISDAVRGAAARAELDWTATSADFERAAGDLVFNLTAGQGSLVTAAGARAHLQDTLTRTVESCSSLPANTASFNIDNPRCLDRVRMASWLETVNPRESALDEAVEALAAGGDISTVMNQLVALVPAGTTGVGTEDLNALGAWVAERVASDNATLRSLLGEYLGLRYVARVHGDQPCTEPCAEPTVAQVSAALSAMQRTATQSLWQRALAEARVSRRVAQDWLSYGFNRDALMAAHGVSSLRDRTPLLASAASALGIAAAAYRADVVDAWAATQLGLNDNAVTLRGSFDSSSGLSGDDTGGITVSGVTYDELVLGQSVAFDVRGTALGAGLVLTMSGCDAALSDGGSSTQRVFSCTLAGDSGWRVLVVSDGLDGTELYRLSVFVKSTASDTPDDGDDGSSDDPIDDPVTPEPPSDGGTISVTSVAPTSATLGASQSFTVRGQGFTSATSVSLSGCNSLSVTSRSATVIRFNCTPSGSAGNRALTVSTGAVSDNTLRVRYTQAEPTVSSVTPTAATVGERQIFTVTGENLNTDLSYTLESCDNLTVLAGASETEQRFRCTPNDAGAQRGAVNDGSTALHTFSVFVAAAANPTVTAVSPETAGMSTPLELVVSGSDLPDSLLVTLDNCSGMTAVTQTATEQVFSCRPAEAGVLSGVVSVDGDELERFTVEVTDDRVAVSEVRPGATRLGAITTFTVSGESLPNTLTLAIENCSDLQPLGGTSVRRQFRCTPTGALGPRDVEVLSTSSSTVPLYTHTLVVAGDGPLVTNVSPTQATVGRSTSFTVVGQSLPTQITFRMDGCTVAPVGTPTTSIHRYRCTLSGAAGVREATVINTRTGETLYSFNVSVSGAT